VSDADGFLHVFVDALLALQLFLLLLEQLFSILCFLLWRCLRLFGLLGCLSLGFSLLFLSLFLEHG